jgi:hypothetical protein
MNIGTQFSPEVALILRLISEGHVQTNAGIGALSPTLFLIEYN